MLGELELTRKPVEGLSSCSLHYLRRDISMLNHINLGFEVQPWKVDTNGLIYYGFSYSKSRKLTQRQLMEFKELRKEATNV